MNPHTHPSPEYLYFIVGGIFGHCLPGGGLFFVFGGAHSLRSGRAVQGFASLGPAGPGAFGPFPSLTQ